jgi:hypothetical protein
MNADVGSEQKFRPAPRTGLATVHFAAAYDDCTASPLGGQVHGSAPVVASLVARMASGAAQMESRQIRAPAPRCGFRWRLMPAKSFELRWDLPIAVGHGRRVGVVQAHRLLERNEVFVPCGRCPTHCGHSASRAVGLPQDGILDSPLARKLLHARYRCATAPLFSSQESQVALRFHRPAAGARIEGARCPKGSESDEAALSSARRR